MRSTRSQVERMKLTPERILKQKMSEWRRKVQQIEEREWKQEKKRRSMKKDFEIKLIKVH